MARSKTTLSIVAIGTAVAPITVTDYAPADTPAINDDHVVYNLLTFIRNEDHTVTSEGGTYRFSAALQNYEWNNPAITASNPTKSETVSFLFKESDELTFSIMAEGQGICRIQLGHGVL